MVLSEEDKKYADFIAKHTFVNENGSYGVDFKHYEEDNEHSFDDVANSICDVNYGLELTGDTANRYQHTCTLEDLQEYVDKKR